MTTLRLLETVHGHLGVLAAAALLHPAILMRRGAALSYRSKWAVMLSTAFAVAAFGSGLVVYPAYREAVRARLFLQSTAAGFLFETKEHIAFAVIALAIGGCTCAMAAPKADAHLRQSAAWLFAAGAGLCLTVVALGSYVTAVQGF